MALKSRNDSSDFIVNYDVLFFTDIFHFFWNSIYLLLLLLQFTQKFNIEAIFQEFPSHYGLDGGLPSLKSNCLTADIVSKL